MSSADALLVAPIAGRKEAVLCGLTWHTVLGKDAVPRSRRLARQQQARFLAQDPGRPEGVGLLSAKRGGRLRAGTQYYSGALILASMYPKGVVVVCLRLSDEQWWIVGVQEGKVLQASDQVVRGEASRDALLGALVERFESSVTLCGDGHEESQESFALETVLAHRHPAHRLQRVRPQLWRHAPRWLAWGGVAAIATLALRLGWDSFGAKTVPSPTLPVEEVERPSPEALFAARTWVFPASAWPVLLDEVAAIPLWLGGWRFRQVDCRPQHRQWQCQVQYERIHAWASNQTFWQARPPDWEISWQPLEAAVARFVPKLSLTRLDPARLPSRHGLDTDWISRLQAERARWSMLAVGPWQNVEEARPGEEAVEIVQRGISVHAPLRHLFRLPVDEQGGWTWHQLLVTLHPQAEASTGQPLLSAQLKGMSYARL